MKYNDMLKEIFGECYRKGVDEKDAYKRASECLHRLLDKYNLDDDAHLAPFISKSSLKNNVEYEFTEEDIQLLKFIRKIDLSNPIDRANVSIKNQNFIKFRKAANDIETEIKSEKYPNITHILQSSLKTEEFLSMHYICDLIVKIVQLLQCACENNYASLTIYNQVNEYLETLLYTYEGTKNFASMIQNEYDKLPDINDKELKLKPISIYNIFNSYVVKIFEMVTNNKFDFASTAIDCIQNLKYDCRYEFKNITQVREFLNTFYEYCNKSNSFRKKYFAVMKTSYSKIADLVIALVTESIEIIDYSEETSEISLTEECSSMFLNAIDALYKELSHIGKDNNDKMEKSITELMIMQNKLRYNFVIQYGNGDFLRFFTRIKGVLNDLLQKHGDCFKEFALIADVFIYIYFDFILYTIIYDENGKITEKIYPTQISYKNFPITLDTLLNFQKTTGLSNEEIVDKIINVLQDAEKQIESDLKYNDKLYSDISNVIGIYMKKAFDNNTENEPPKEDK